MIINGLVIKFEVKIFNTFRMKTVESVRIYREHLMFGNILTLFSSKIAYFSLTNDLDNALISYSMCLVILTNGWKWRFSVRVDFFHPSTTVITDNTGKRTDSVQTAYASTRRSAGRRLKEELKKMVVCARACMCV